VDKSLLVLATKEAEDNCQRSIMKAQQLIVFHLSTMTQVATDTNNLILVSLLIDAAASPIHLPLTV